MEACLSFTGMLHLDLKQSKYFFQNKGFAQEGNSLNEKCPIDISAASHLETKCSLFCFHAGWRRTLRCDLAEEHDPVSHLCLSRVQAPIWAEQIPGYAFCPRCLPPAPKETTASVATAMLFWVKHPLSPWHPEVVPHLYSKWPVRVVPGFFTVLSFSWNVSSTGRCLGESRFVLRRAAHGKTNCMTASFAAALAGFDLNLSWSLSFTSEGLSLRHRELGFQILCPLSSLPPLACAHSR